jgi:hypothetical protein
MQLISVSKGLRKLRYTCSPADFPLRYMHGHLSFKTRWTGFSQAFLGLAYLRTKEDSGWMMSCVSGEEGASEEILCSW